MKLKVQVNEDDIRLGMPNHCEKCPIARAISRIRPDDQVAVGIGQIDIGHFWSLGVPKRAVQFITQFDAGATVKPFTFTLKLEEW